MTSLHELLVKMVDSEKEGGMFDQGFRTWSKVRSGRLKTMNPACSFCTDGRNRQHSNNLIFPAFGMLSDKALPGQSQIPPLLR